METEAEMPAEQRKRGKKIKTKRNETSEKANEAKMAEKRKEKTTDDRDNTPGPKRRGGARKRALKRAEGQRKHEEGRREQDTNDVGWRWNGQRPVRRQIEDEEGDGQKGQDKRNGKPCDQR